MSMKNMLYFKYIYIILYFLSVIFTLHFETEAEAGAAAELRRQQMWAGEHM